MSFNAFWQRRYSTPPYDLHHNPFGFKHGMGSDISAHLPFLEFLARQCYHITEFGTRGCCSTSAFIKGCKGKVVSYDIETRSDIENLKQLHLPCEWEFHLQSTIDPNLDIEETDLLFIDTDHTYEQVKQELELHGNKVKKYIVFHDTYSFSKIIPAIDEFLATHPQWKVTYNVIFNHGLMVIEHE